MHLSMRGAVLLQDNGPIEYALRALSPTEQNYAHIEKEMLTIVFGCIRFHQYIFGKKVVVNSNHQRLEAKFKQPLHSATPRLQRLMVKILQYDLEVEYRHGKDVRAVNALSRNHADEICEPQLDTENFVMLINESLQVSDLFFKNLQQHTANDNVLKCVSRYILNGWLERIAKVDKLAKPYWIFRENLSFVNDIMLKSEKNFIPISLKQEVLQKTHTCHLVLINVHEEQRM